MLGVPLHYTRLFVLLGVLPKLPTGLYGGEMILLAWSLTEVCRYPMYLFPSPFTTALRDKIPVLTFPLGAGFEAYACYLFATQNHGFLASLAYLQVFINVVLGSFLVYPGIVKRGLGAKPVAKVAPPQKGTLFPKNPDGTRSSTPFGKAIIAKALVAAGDSKASEACGKERVWRFKYHKYFMSLVRSSCKDPEKALNSAKTGIDFFYEQFEFADPKDPAKIVSFAANLRDNKGTFDTGVVKGATAQSKKVDYGVPYNGGW